MPTSAEQIAQQKKDAKRCISVLLPTVPGDMKFAFLQSTHSTQSIGSFSPILTLHPPSNLAAPLVDYALNSTVFASVVNPGLNASRVEGVQDKRFAIR